MQWMYLVPLGFIVMNAMTQAMNMPEEQQVAGQSTSQGQVAQRAPTTATTTTTTTVRRR